MSLGKPIQGFEILLIYTDLEVLTRCLRPSLMVKMKCTHRTMNRMDVDGRSQTETPAMHADKTRRRHLNRNLGGHGGGLGE